MKTNYSVIKVLFGLMVFYFLSIASAMAQSITINTPTNGQTIAPGATMNITVSIAGGTVSNVTYWVDNWIWIGQPTTSPYSLSWTNNLTNGSHILKARANFSDGSSAEAVDRTFNVGTVGDIQAPSVPTGLASSSITQTTFTLSWSASTDNVGVTGYEVFRNGVSIGTTNTTSMNVTGLSASTAYSMTVRARDAANNWSAQSSALNVTTSASSGGGPSGYTFSVNEGGTVPVTGTMDIAYGANGTFLYKLNQTTNQACTNANFGSDPVPTVIKACYVRSTVSDNVAPSVPAGLASSSITQTTFTLSWSASTDNVGVTGYEVFRNGVSIGTTNTTSMNVTGLSASTAYSMTVRARDAANNWSAQSSALNVTTSASSGGGPSGYTFSVNEGGTVPVTGTMDIAYGANGTFLYKLNQTTNQACTNANFGSDPVPTVIKACYVRSSVSDNIAPSVPTGLVSSSITQTTFTLSWSASTDNVGVTGYEVFRNGVSIGTTNTTSMNVTGLSASTAYSMTVRARDAANNWSAQSSALSVTTSANPSGGATIAQKVLSTINVDGNLNETEWSSPSIITNSVTKVVSGTPNNTVTYGALWNSTYLYVGVRVLDANLFSNGANLWDNDAVEIFVDANNNNGATYDANDIQIVKAYNSSTVWSSRTAAGVVANWLAISGGYTVEVAIPWSVLGVTPPSNGIVGFDIGIDDNDAGAGRTSQLVWKGDANNWSSTANFGDLTISSQTVGTPSAPDTQAPSTPTGLASSSVGQTSLNLNWTASTDNVGITGYDVYRNGSFLASTFSNSYNATGLSCATGYSFYVRAKDAAGNLSANSNTINVNTFSCTPSGSGTMALGTNFWDPYWSNSTEYFVASPTFTSGSNPWNATFLSEIGIYKCLRFMDFGHTNNSNVTSWSQRTPPNNNQTSSSACPNGIAYEWMVDLCNRKNADLWICLPHKTDLNYWTQLATLIKNGANGYPGLNSNLKVYVEYSNETWNGGFTQFQYTIDEGVAQGLPGSNQWYKGGAYSVWQSVKIFKAFQDVFGVAAMGSRVVRVCSASGNYDIADQAFASILSSGAWNPNSQKVDMFAIAPYVGGGLDGANGSIQSQFRNDINITYTDRVLPAETIANKYGMELGCYEGGQHLLTNAQIWSANSQIYDEYLYMMNTWKPKFKLFCHYTHLGSWNSGGAWGAKESTTSSLASSHKYRALVDWVSANSAREEADLTEEVEVSTSTVSIVPNPSKGLFTVLLSSGGSATVKVFDFTGKLISETVATEGKAFLNISGHATGLYLLKVNVGRSRSTHKIVVE